MTKEELEKEAEESATRYMNEHTEKYNCENTKLETDNYNAGREYGYEEGYLAGAEPRENQITELKQKLKQAEEIIRKYYNYNPSCEYSYEDIDKLAEQFLKEKT